MSLWFDTHCHLNDPEFEKDRDEVIRRMMEARVGRAAVVGYDAQSSALAVELADAYPGLYAAVGVHPHDAKTYDQAVEDGLRSLLSHPKVVAFGEIGLDYHYDHSPRPVQQDKFRLQIRLGKAAGLPLIIHEREATADLLKILEEEAAGEHGGVMHCFSGSPETAKIVVEMGFHIGIDGPVTFANARKIPEVLQAVPINRLLLETDCPYLTPVPYRGRRNEPAYLPLVGEAVAKILGMTTEAVARQTTENAEKLFLLG